MDKNKESENDSELVQNALNGDMTSLGLLFTKLRPIASRSRSLPFRLLPTSRGCSFRYLCYCRNKARRLKKTASL